MYHMSLESIEHVCSIDDYSAIAVQALQSLRREEPVDVLNLGDFRIREISLKIDLGYLCLCEAAQELENHVITYGDGVEVNILPSSPGIN